MKRLTESVPPAQSAAQFFIGQNKDGQWVVQDKQGLYGGLFAEFSDALRFAMLENGNRADTIVMVPGIFDLDLPEKT